MSQLSSRSISPSSNFEQARLAMVDSQLYTSGVLTETVLDAYRSVPREMFVPPGLRGVCYLDDTVKFPNGRFLLEPLIHALMVENAALGPRDKVLDIGGYTGYSTAILGRLAQYVVAVEADASALEIAKENWLKLGLSQTTTVPVCAPHQSGCAAYSPYDVIIINGSVAHIPQTIQDQLAPHGRLLCIEKQSGDVGQIRLYTKQNGHLGSTIIADAAAPYLPGFEPVPAFKF
jgi:protein-L-isoaspartate(D-aspartate) O-methyltransferase